MVNFNTNIIKDNRYDYLFNKLEKKYGSFRTYTKDEIDEINKINNLSKNQYSEINLIGGENSLSSDNTTSSTIINYYSNFPFFSSTIINYYSNFPFFIFNLSLILLILSLISNFLLDLPEIKKQFGKDIRYISKILANIVKGICILNINISLFSIYYNSEAINNFKKKSILSYILVLLVSFTIIYFYYYQITNYIYNYKLQGILIPLGAFGLFVPVYHLYQYTYNYFYNQSKKTKENIVLRYVREVKNLYFNAVDLIPELIYTPLPNIPKISNNNVVFSFIRNGIQSLMIDVPGGDAYQIKINLPVVKLPFVNFNAIFCCLAIFIKKLAKLIYDKVISPIAKVITPIWDKIVEIFNTFVRVVIRPIIDFFNKLVKIVTDIWNALWWNGIYVFIYEILNFINDILIKSGLSKFLKGLSLEPILKKFRATKEADRRNEKNRAKKAAQEKKNMGNAKAVEKAANKKAVKKTLSKMHKNNKELDNPEDLDEFIKKSEEGIGKLKGGGNNTICYMVKKRKDKYIKNYYKRLNDKIDINYPRAKTPALFEEVCSYTENLDKCNKYLHKKEKNKNKAKKYNRDYNTCKRFDYDLEKNKISSPVCKKIFKHIEIEDLYKTPNLNNVLSSTYVYRFRNNVLNIERYYKIYNKNKNNRILDKITHLQEDNNIIFKKLYPIIKNVKFTNKKQINNRRFNMYFKGGWGWFTETFVDPFVEAANQLADMAEKAYNTVAEAASDAFNAIKDFATNCLADPIKCVNDIANAIAAAVNSAIEAAKAAVKAIGDALEKIGEALKDLAEAAINWVKNAINSLINEAKKLMDAAKAPIEEFKNFFKSIRDFFVIQLGQKIPEVFNKIKDFIVSTANKTVEIINEIGDIIKKYAPLIIKIIKNVAKIIEFFIKTVINQFLKIPKLLAMWIKLLLKIAKAIIKAAMNAVKGTVKDAAGGSSNIPPFVQLLMTIMDLPFKYIFQAIEKIIDVITAIFDYKTIENVIDKIKGSFNKALNILKRIPCIVIVPISVAIDGAESLCNKFGFSLIGLMPGFIRNILAGIQRFNDSKCMNKQKMNRAIESPNKDNSDELSWELAKENEEGEDDKIDVDQPFQLGGNFISENSLNKIISLANQKSNLKLLTFGGETKEKEKESSPPPKPDMDSEDIDFKALQKYEGHQKKDDSKKGVKKDVKKQQKEEDDLVRKLSKPVLEKGTTKERNKNILYKIDIMIKAFERLKKIIYLGVEEKVIEEYALANVIHTAELNLCPSYPCNNYYYRRWFDYYIRQLKKHGINNTMGEIKEYAAEGILKERMKPMRLNSYFKKLSKQKFLKKEDARNSFR